MSAIIFDHDHLSTSLLPGESTANGVDHQGAEGGSAGQEQPTDLETSSTTDLDSSRRSLNGGFGGRETEVKERVFSGQGVIVELSKTDSKTSSRRMEKSLSRARYSYGESVDGSEEEEEDDDELLGSRVSHQLLINNATQSYANSTLPRPYNPGILCRNKD